MLGAHMLIVDDEPDIRTILRRLFLEDGWFVCEAGDGQEALTAAQHCDVSMVVMDLMMPRMDGASAIRMLRAEPRYATTPILVISAHAALMPTITATGVGNIRLLTKPLNLDQVRDTVHELVASA
jgi:DNA-binding response OmpR family regulator